MRETERPAPPVPGAKAEGTPADFLEVPASLRGSLRADLLRNARALAQVKLRQEAEAKREHARMVKLQAPPKQRMKRRQKPILKGQHLANLPVRTRIVELRVQGKLRTEIAEELGVCESTVDKHLRKWVLSQSPPDEHIEEVRKVFNERLERLHDKHWDAAMGSQDEDGSWLVPPSMEAGEFCLKIMDRAAKLNGVDMQPSTQTLLISAESIAAYLGWDPQGEQHTAIDVEATSVRELPPAEESPGERTGSGPGGAELR